MPKDPIRRPLPTIPTNVSKVLDTLNEDPILARELQTTLAKLYEKAGVNLSQNEKALLMNEFGRLVGQNAAVVAWV